MASFDEAFNITVKGNEAGYNRGGETIAETFDGIDRAQQPNNKVWPIIDKIKKANPTATVAQLNALFRDNAELQSLKLSFYTNEFWSNLSLSSITDQQVANVCFDCSVNPCIDTAGEVMQKACNAVIINTGIKLPKLKIDGAIGSKTVSMINSLDAWQVYNAINTIRMGNYYRRGELTPKMIVWVPVWLARLKPYKGSIK